MSTPDYSDWLTKDEAAAIIGVTPKTVTRMALAGQIQQGRWQREGRGPTLAVFHPEDVRRIALARRSGPPAPFLVPGEVAPTNGNGHHGGQALAIAPGAPPAGDDLLHALVTAAMQAMSRTSRTSALFRTLPEASAFTGLTQAFLKRMIDAGTLTAIRDRGWRIRRKDLEAL